MAVSWRARGAGRGPSGRGLTGRAGPFWTPLPCTPQTPPLPSHAHHLLTSWLSPQHDSNDPPVPPSHCLYATPLLLKSPLLSSKGRRAAARHALPPLLASRHRTGLAQLNPHYRHLRCYLFILLRLDCIPPLPHFHPAAEEKRGCAKRSPLKHTATNVKQALQGAWQLNSTSLINTRPHCGRPVFSLLRPGAPRPSSSLCADNLTSPTEDKTKL